MLLHSAAYLALALALQHNSGEFPQPRQEPRERPDTTRPQPRCIEEDQCASDPHAWMAQSIPNGISWQRAQQPTAQERAAWHRLLSRKSEARVLPLPSLPSLPRTRPRQTPRLSTMAATTVSLRMRYSVPTRRCVRARVGRKQPRSPDCQAHRTEARMQHVCSRLPHAVSTDVGGPQGATGRTICEHFGFFDG